MFPELEDSIRGAKQRFANADFDSLLNYGNIAFYKACEVTQIFIFDKQENTAINFYTLFTFDELEVCDEKAIFLSEKLTINKRYFCGIQQKRISLESAKNCFSEIQRGILNYDGECNIAKDLCLLPKMFVPQQMTEPVLLNYILKPNYWGDSYVIEFFDEQKSLLTEFFNNRELCDKIFDYINSCSKIRLDLSKVYDRIGNIIFQFPVTLYYTATWLEQNGNDIHFMLKAHPFLKEKRRLHIEISAHFDDVITGYDCLDTDELDFEHTFCPGDDYNLTVTIHDKDSKLLLFKSEGNFLKELNMSMNLGMQYSKPRTIECFFGHKEIELVQRDVFGRNNNRYSYSDWIFRRTRDNEIIRQSKKLGIFKANQRAEALSFLHDIVKSVSADFSAVCLWDPYLMPSDIVNTLYFENSGMEFRCITDYQKTKGAFSVNNFTDYKSKIKQEFCRLSNNYGVHLKLLAHHDGFGWEFHDRFLILVPKNATQLPQVYSLGISVNQLGNSHHIIQQVPNPRIILKNFEELWEALDNDDCRVISFPEKEVSHGI